MVLRSDASSCKPTLEGTHVIVPGTGQLSTPYTFSLTPNHLLVKADFVIPLVNRLLLDTF